MLEANTNTRQPLNAPARTQLLQKSVTKSHNSLLDRSRDHITFDYYFPNVLTIRNAKFYSEIFSHWLQQWLKPHGKALGLDQADLQIFLLCFEHFIYYKYLSFHTRMRKLMLARIVACSSILKTNGIKKNEISDVCRENLAQRPNNLT